MRGQAAKPFPERKIGFSVAQYVSGAYYQGQGCACAHLRYFGVEVRSSTDLTMPTPDETSALRFKANYGHRKKVPMSAEFVGL
jgi:hypothetical protein